MATQFVSLASPSWGERVLSNTSIRQIVLIRMRSVRLYEVKDNSMTKESNRKWITIEIVEVVQIVKLIEIVSRPLPSAYLS